MDGDEDGGAVVERQRPSAKPCRSSSGRPSTLRAAVAPSATMTAGLHDRALQVLPPAAAVDLIGIRPLVQPPLAAHFVFEVLDRVGDEDVLALDAGVRQRPVQQRGRPGRRTAGRPCLPGRRAARRPASSRRAAVPAPALPGWRSCRAGSAGICSRPCATPTSEVTTGPSSLATSMIEFPTHAVSNPAMCLSTRNKSTKAELVSQPEGSSCVNRWPPRL